MSRRIQHAARFLTANDVIASLLSDIEQHARVLREIRRVLPANLAEHCLHAAMEDDTLVLLTDSPVWASRLRFFAPELHRSLTAKQGRAAKFRVRVQPSSASSARNPSPHSKIRLSAETVRHLLETAEATKDEDIAAAFRRLAAAGGG